MTGNRVDAHLSVLDHAVRLSGGVLDLLSQHRFVLAVLDGHFIRVALNIGRALHGGVSQMLLRLVGRALLVDHVELLVH